MFGLGPQELIIVLLIALIVFGPKRLPEIGRSLGSGLRELKKASRDVMSSLETDVSAMEEDKNVANRTGSGDS